MGHARAVVAAAVGALALPASGTAALGETSARAVFTLDPDGVLQVLERIHVPADAPTASSWQVTMQRGELFARPSVVVGGRRYRPGDGKRPGTFRISRGTRGIRFDWTQPAGLREVRLGYLLALFGTAYTDVVDLRVPFWESGWPAPVRELTGTLMLPRVPHGRVIVWVEPSFLGARVTPLRRQIRLVAHDVPARNSVTLRAVLPRRVLTSVGGVNVQSKPGLAAILHERRAKSAAWWRWALVAAGLALAVSAVALRTARWHRLRRR